MNIVVIPARGGSKGLPGKNIKYLNGKPLIAWTIEAALAESLVDKIIVSTDSEEIAIIARSFGAEIDYRPANLATDEATTIDVLQELISRFPEAKYVVVLQPTSPIRDKGLIDQCIDAYIKGNYTNLATGYWCKFQEFGSHNNVRRQDYKGFFYDDGNVYVLSRELVERGKWCGENPCKFPIEKHMNFEIDDLIDFVILDALIINLKNIK